MIVIGADTHKRSHTLAAVDEATGRALADVTVAAAPRSFGELLRWARGVGDERVWALEDCRHVSGSLERFLLKRGERVVRVPPKLMAGARDSTREQELAALVVAFAPRLAADPGCGTLIAAKLIGEIAGVARFASDAKLARLSGAAPIPASSGRTDRHRLDPGGNRQLNCALYRLALTKARPDPETQALLARKQAEGKTRREARR